MKNIVVLVCLLSSFSLSAKMNKELPWHGKNLEALTNHFATWKKEKGKKYAAFDWDNTMVKNDVGNAFFYWMLTHDLIKTQANWKDSSTYLSKKALEELNTHCPFNQTSPVLQTSTNIACLDLLLSISESHLSKKEDKAFDESKYNANLVEPSYAFVAQLLQGYSPSEIQKIARQMKKFQLGNDIGYEEKIGSKMVDGYIRYYDQMKDLVKEFKANKFQVYIISASAQPIVEVFAEEVGIDAKHVIGIRQIIKDKKITTTFEACEGNNDLISYREGKRCWLKKVVNAPMTFAAGDSDTDFQFVSDATDLRLVINRNKAELMCHAYGDTDGKWIINPMFIKAKAKKATPYECEAFGLANQEDKVF
ncbi:MAG: HAD family hydrolase [Bacteriovoracaceae bacterium]